jgi:outer membrane receptor for ferrienterochelin and colicins
MAAARVPPIAPAAPGAPTTDRTSEASLSGRVLADHAEAVKNAVLTLESTDRGHRKAVRSNAQGYFTFPGLAGGDYRLTVRAAGFVPEQRDLTVGAGQSQTLEFHLALPSSTVVVQEQLRAPVAQGALANDIVKTESIGSRELQKTGATSLTDAVCHRPGIDIQIGCSVCNARDITLNNLPGRYTTLTLDGIPLFSPVSNAYGLDMLGVDGLDSIDVSRGAGTSLTTPESLAGTVNLVSRTPTEDTVEGDLSGGDRGYRRGSVYGAKTFRWGAVSLTGTHQQHDSVDGVGLGISQFTGYDRNLAGLGLFLSDLGGFKVKARFDHVEEKRMGGPLGHDYGAVLASTTGNPFNFSAGPNASPDPDRWMNPSTGNLVDAYDQGRSGMAQIVYTTRNQLVATADGAVGESRLHLGIGYAHHHQSSWYGGDSDYWDWQQQAYLDGNLQRIIGGVLVTIGANFKYEGLHSDSISQDPEGPYFGMLRHDVDTYTYQTPGIYLQGYATFFKERLEVNGSLREDRNNAYGSITTPRLNVLWHHTGTLASRIALGTGYRLPTSFFEQNHGLLGETLVGRAQAKPERSVSCSYALSYADDRTTVTGSLNRTQINDMATFVTNTREDTGIFELQPARHPFIVTSVDVVGTWKATPRDAITLGLEGYHYTFDPAEASNAGLFSRPDYRISLSYDHAAGPWDFDIRGTFTGPQDLAKWYDYADSPRFNLDGTPKQGTSPSFWVVDLHTSYQFSKVASAYLGLTNLFDYQQARHDSFLWADANGGLDVTHIWGPNIGRQWVLGAKIGF